MVVAHQVSASPEDETDELSGEEDLKHFIPFRISPPDAAQRQPHRAAWLAGIAGSGGGIQKRPLPNSKSNGQG